MKTIVHSIRLRRRASLGLRSTRARQRAARENYRQANRWSGWRGPSSCFGLDSGSKLIRAQAPRLGAPTALPTDTTIDEADPQQMQAYPVSSKQKSGVFGISCGELHPSVGPSSSGTPPRDRPLAKNTLLTSAVCSHWRRFDRLCGRSLQRMMRSMHPLPLHRKQNQTVMHTTSRETHTGVLAVSGLRETAQRFLSSLSLHPAPRRASSVEAPGRSTANRTRSVDLQKGKVRLMFSVFLARIRRARQILDGIADVASIKHTSPERHWCAYIGTASLMPSSQHDPPNVSQQLFRQVREHGRQPQEKQTPQAAPTLTNAAVQATANPLLC